MTLKSSTLAGTVILCSIALSACAPAKKRIVTISPGSAQTSTVVRQEVVPQPQRVVRRNAPTTRATSQPTSPRPIAIAAPSRPSTTTTAPVIPVAVAVKPAKKDCSISDTPGCPVKRSFGAEDTSAGSGGGGGGGGWDG